MADLPSFSTKEFYWLASCFCGIITCKLVYDITGFISPFCFKGYGKLSDKEKMEWNNRKRSIKQPKRNRQTDIERFQTQRKQGISISPKKEKETADKIFGFLAPTKKNERKY
ncbi:hypothetical protein ERO13_D12G000600v2 [Gossypium hirsutum]|uniref:Uncharacterized protein LOC107931033 n=2 Tax=Gossypium TaxID=3633 RepID=A0A1U8LUS3_GOSHI|nr:uncharacterized protein LOC107931033 [Gossypium hirsutum]XP_016718314.1 uncharacterized protein LOC107931033 [Gossypium hirsutum]XP_016718323.1 uncharacterized protein LOC107931033 [Gossypium hirsutum]TYH36846.1 hypothetical protein ES332_D12G000500v1 [Gossypium tomentosum]KAG4113723.1 hypothetical protein ERO13_D12G000600v2 [Gossypium hirsutum]KAG4113724.1 hypothetical protein ERO13_D12G000600v2 [Gossypium hirsutum]TYH36847.1 hypothetical protein ES332_D12G000500v1 [Gossypium tomentosum]